jgi:hypothetical protein
MQHNLLILLIHSVKKSCFTSGFIFIVGSCFMICWWYVITVYLYLLKDRQYNGQTKKDKRTNNDLQNTKLKIHEHKRGELRCCGRVSISYSTSDIRRVVTRMKTTQYVLDKQLEVKMNRTSFLYRNRNGHHNMELRT